MTKKPYKKSYYGFAVFLFVVALRLIIPALQGRTMNAWAHLGGGVPVSSKQMLGAGIVSLIWACILFFKGFRIAIDNMTLSESLENKDQRENRQNKKLDPTRETPVDEDKFDSREGHF